MQTSTWHCHSDIYMCVWCRNIYRDRRATYLHHQQSWKRRYCTGRCSHLHTVDIQVIITCSHCDQHFESVAMLLEHLRTELPLDRRNAELGLDAGGRERRRRGHRDRSALEAHRGSRTQTHRSKCCSFCPGLGTRSGAHLLHDTCEARRTFGADEQRGDGTLRDQIEGGTATSRRAARSRMGGHDDGSDHGHSTFGGRQAESGGTHVQRELTGDSFAEHLLEPVQKKHFRRTGSSGSVQWTPRLSPSCASSSKP